MLPILLIYLDSDNLGLWYVMQSFSALASLFTFGFTPAFARNVAYSWNGAIKLSRSGKEQVALNEGEVNFQLLKEVICASKVIYLIISIVAVGVIGILGTVHIENIAKTVISANIRVAWYVFLGAIFLNIYYGYYHSYIIGIGLIKKANQILLLSGILRVLVMILFMQFDLGLLGISAAYFVYGFIYRTLCKRAFYNVKEFKENRKKYQAIQVSKDRILKSISVIWYNAWRDGIVSCANYLQTQASTLVCSGFLTLSQTATYSLTVQLITIISSIAQSIQNAYVPLMQAAFIREDKKVLKRTHAFCLFVYTLVYTIGVCGLLLVGVPIVSRFKPDVTISRFFLLLYAIYQFMLTWRNCYGVYLSCTNRVIYWKSYIISGGVCILIYSFLLAHTDLGIWGIAIASILTEGMYNFWKWTRLVNKELGLQISDFFRIGKEELKGLLRVF